MMTKSVCVFHILVFIHLFLPIYGENITLIKNDEIKNFTEFLEMNLNRHVLNYKIKRLTKPGDNFGAIVQAVDVNVADDVNDVHLVIKTPIVNPFLAAFFQPAVSFVKEVHFYSDIIPAIEHFEQISNVSAEERLDAFIQCLGWRISLDPNAEKADADAILLLENIKFQNFSNGNKHIGFDTDETLATLKVLAKFHALCIAMRRLQPKLYTTKVYPYLMPLDNFAYEYDNPFEFLYNELRLVENLPMEMRSKVENNMKIGEKFHSISTRANDTPYSTVSHGDMWINNVMIKKDSNAGDSIKVRIYDFQLYYYESFVHDLMYFLLSSVQSNDLKTNFMSFIDCYIMEFEKTMNSIQCPFEDYTYEKLWNEIREKAKFSLFPAILNAKFTHGKNDSSSSENNEDDIFPLAKPASQAVIQQWKLVIDVLFENDLM